MLDNEFSPALCEENERLRREIEQILSVRFFRTTGDSYGCRIKKKDRYVEIQCVEPIEDEKIAHELLHAKVAIALGDCFLLSKLAEQSINVCRMLLNDKICGHILNCVEHVIAYPIYNDMGFEPDKYFEDSEESEEGKSQFESLTTYGIKANGVYSITGLLNFINHVVSYMFYPIDKRWQTQLKDLGRMDRELYAVIKNFYQKVKAVTLEKDNQDTMNKIYQSFYDEMNQWVSGKKFV